MAAHRTVMTMMQLHDGGGAPRPSAVAVASVNGAAEMRSDGGGAAAEMKGIALVIFEHGEQTGIAGQPAGGIAPEHNAGWFKAIGGSG